MEQETHDIEEEAVDMMAKEIWRELNRMIFLESVGLSPHIETVNWRVPRNGHQDGGFRYATFENGSLRSTNADEGELRSRFGDSYRNY